MSTCCFLVIIPVLSRKPSTAGIAGCKFPTIKYYLPIFHGNPSITPATFTTVLKNCWDTTKIGMWCWTISRITTSLAPNLAWFALLSITIAIKMPIMSRITMYSRPSLRLSSSTPTRILLSSRTSWRGSMSWRQKIIQSKKYPRSTAPKTFGTSNLRLRTKAEE